MKKIAILGTSNSIMKHGYVHFLQKYPEISVYSFGVGDVSSIYAIYKLLTENILDNFDCCVLDYSINEHIFMKNNDLPEKRVIFYLLSIISLFNKKHCIPYFILLSPRHIDTINNNLYRDIFNYFKCPYTDFDNIFSPIKSNDIYEGDSHYNLEFQEIIAKKLYKDLSNTSLYNSISKIDFDFFSLNPISFFTLSSNDISSTLYDLPRKTHQNSLLTVNSFLLTEKDQLHISTQHYPIGVIFWNSDENSTIYFNFPNITIKKNFHLKWKGLLSCRSIINTQKGNIKICMNEDRESIEESVHNSVQIESKHESFYLVDILFTDANPIEYVDKFIKFKNNIQLSFFLKNEIAINEKTHCFIPHEGSDELIVSFASHNHGNRYFQFNSLISQKRTNLLFLCDPQNTYYLDSNNGENYSQLLDKYIEKFPRNRITLYGHSMAGYAALYFGVMKNLNILCSMPQVDLNISKQYAWQDLKKTLNAIHSNIDLPSFISEHIKESIIYLIYGNCDIDLANSNLLIEVLKNKGRFFIDKVETSEHAFLLHDVQKIYKIHNLLCYARSFKL